MIMFTEQENKDLTKLIASTINPKKKITLDWLHGFLFLLAILPEPVDPMEWVPDICNEKILDEDDQVEAKRTMGVLLSAYYRIIQLNRDGELVFPFVYAPVNSKDVMRLRNWAKGFYIATNIRPDIWKIDEYNSRRGKSTIKMLENEIFYCKNSAEIAKSFLNIMLVAFPILMKDTFVPGKNNVFSLDQNDPNLEQKLFNMIPNSVATLRMYAEVGGCGSEPPKALTYSEPSKPLRVVKTGRNDTCPCGSGAKYKKCCGRHSAPP